MGLDIYAGTLTRYYAHNWKTMTQQWAEEYGIGYEKAMIGGPEPEYGDPREIQKGMEHWRDWILTAITQPDREPYAPWTEDNESPYYTNKPDWDALGAMLLVAACRTYGEEIPAMVTKGWKFMEHPVIRRMVEDPGQGWSLFHGTEWWLPVPETFLFQAPRPTGDQRGMATTGLLRWELEKLNALAWQAEEDTILTWSRTEGYPVDGRVGPEGFTIGKEHSEYDTVSLAKFAFSLFWQAVQFSQEHGVPILLDY